MLHHRTLLASLSILALAASVAHAASIDGLKVTDLGTPACYKPNPFPTVNSGGTFYSRLPMLNGDMHGTTNPWTQWPLAKFRGATYSALYAQSFSPGLVVYDFSTPQSSMTLVIGTPDAGESIVFKNGTTPVATLMMSDVLAAFGFRNGINVSIKMPAGVTFERAAFSNAYEGAAFEFANLNAKCN